MISLKLIENIKLKEKTINYNNIIKQLKNENIKLNEEKRNITLRDLITRIRYCVKEKRTVKNFENNN
jgi:hypothetical protein